MNVSRRIGDCCRANRFVVFLFFTVLMLSATSCSPGPANNDVIANIALFSIIGVTALTGGIALAIGITKAERDKAEIDLLNRAAELQALRKDLDGRQQTVEQWELKAAEHCKELDAFHRAEKANLEKSRRETDEYYQRGMEMVRAAQQALKTAPEPQAIGKYLRDRHLQGAAFGDFILVNFLGDPSGFIRLKWEVLLKRNEPPIVVISRDQKLIRTDASFSGEHGDHIVPGRRYIYHFSVRDEKEREFGKPLWLEVKIPTKKAWGTPSAGDVDEQERQIRETFKARWNGRKVVRELVERETEVIKAKHYPPEIEEWFLAQLDALAAELGGQ